MMRGVSKHYRRGLESVPVLDDFDLEVAAGAFVALMGPSGSGKTTILNLVGALDEPDQGHIQVGPDTLTGMDRGQLPAWRARHVGFVFQSFNLVPVLTARENVLLPLALTPLGRAERNRQAQFALELVGLQDRMDHRPRQLSGGQEQRVAIARAIATDPDLILADEPTGNLDRESADAIMALLARLHVELKKTVLIVTHDQMAAARCERVLQLDKGRLRAEEPPEGGA